MITGVTGFTGRALAKELIRRKHHVIGVVRDLSKIETSLLEHEQFSPVEYKETSSSLLVGIDGVKVDAIIHLATHTPTKPDATECEKLVHANVLFGIQLLKVMKDLNCKVFINASTYWQLNQRRSCTNERRCRDEQLFEDCCGFSRRLRGL